MLMIRRRCGESIFLGDNVEVQVLEVAGGRVTLGISAPRDVLVLRSELRLTEQFNREASLPVATARVATLAASLWKRQSVAAKG
jgi:carbon storage regulator